MLFFGPGGERACSEVPGSGPVAAQQMVEAALLGLDTVHNEHCNVRTTSQRYSSDSKIARATHTQYRTRRRLLVSECFFFFVMDALHEREIG